MKIGCNVERENCSPAHSTSRNLQFTSAAKTRGVSGGPSGYKFYSDYLKDYNPLENASISCNNINNQGTSFGVSETKKGNGKFLQTQPISFQGNGELRDISNQIQVRQGRGGEREFFVEQPIHHSHIHARGVKGNADQVLMGSGSKGLASKQNVIDLLNRTWQLFARDDRLKELKGNSQPIAMNAMKENNPLGYKPVGYGVDGMRDRGNHLNNNHKSLQYAEEWDLQGTMRDNEDLSEIRQVSHSTTPLIRSHLNELEKRFNYSASSSSYFIYF
jgi:hypothetical protein